MKSIINELNEKIDQTSPKGFLLALIAVFILRAVLELFSDALAPDFAQYTHYFMFYVVTLSAMMLIYHAFLREKFTRTVKILSFGFIIILLPPLLDLLLSGGNGFDMGYLQPQSWTELLIHYVTYWQGFTLQVVTPGIKIEILIMIVFTIWYIGRQRKSVLIGLLAGLSVYTLLFILSAFPFFMWKFYNLIGLNIDASQHGLIFSYLLFAIPLLLALALVWNRQAVKVLLKDLRFLRITHYMLMSLAGVMIAASLTKDCPICTGGWVEFVFLILSVIFAWIYSLISNNIADYRIDAVSNESRPLFQGWDVDQYKKLGYGSLIISLLFVALIPFKTGFFVIVFIAGYFLYSQPPFRLKRIPILSKFLIAFNTWALVIAGFTFGGRSPLLFPPKYTLIFIVAYGLALNFIDIKDYKGDKKDGILTLPVLLGEKKGKLVVALLMFLGYLIAGLVLNYLGVLIVCIAGGLLSLIFILTIDRSDKWIMATYLISIALVMVVVKLPATSLLTQSIFK